MRYDYHKKILAYRVLPTLLGHNARGCPISRSARGGLWHKVWRAYGLLLHNHGSEGRRDDRRRRAVVIGEAEAVEERARRRERGGTEEGRGGKGRKGKKRTGKRKREGDEGF
jgi:hypothetical protein